MTTKQKAKDLVDFFSLIVYPFVGSDYLIGHETPAIILKNAKTCAHKCVDEMINASTRTKYISWCYDIKQEIDLITE